MKVNRKDSRWMHGVEGGSCAAGTVRLSVEYGSLGAQSSPGLGKMNDWGAA